jgi:histidinol dehydrogenase
MERFDGYRLTARQLSLSADEIARGAEKLPPPDRAALTRAAERIRYFHGMHLAESWSEEGPGERLGQLVRPLASVGLYAPAAVVPLASTVLMLGVPASVAGVPDLALAAQGREIHPAMLEAALLSGVTRVHRLSGAQAVGALAYGTESVARVDKIVGPGSVYTQEAKRQVFGEVDIDSEAGPSEVFIVAEEGADPVLLAADLLAQAEHGPRSGVVLASPSVELVAATREQLEAQLAALPSDAMARPSMHDAGALIVTRDLDEAIDLANRYASEHLQLFVEDRERWLPRVENAGAIFIGPYTPVPLGDYNAGPSHVLPTGGTARFFSVLGVADFQKRMSVVEFSAQGFERVAKDAARLAELEGLFAHARAIQLRLERSATER